MIKINIEQRSEAWHEARCGRFTASSFSDLMAGEQTAAYQNLIAEIAGEILTGESEDDYQSPAMERGIELEPEARKRYEETLEVKVEQIGFIIPDDEDEFHDWIGMSPDGLPDDGLVEIKCPLIKTYLNYIDKNVLPNDYKWQVQGQLMISGLNWCDFMSYYPGLKPFIIRVLPDPAMHEQLKTRLRKAIQDVKNKILAYKKYTYDT
jgi:putative phage-type endonuclease